MTERKNRLGRGLSALLGDHALEPEQQTGLNLVPIGDLVPGPYQARKDFSEEELENLAASLRDVGMMQPIVARRGADNQLEIVAGERRWRAAQRAQMHDVPVIVREIGDRESLEIGLIENLQRQDLAPLEEATGYARLRDEFGLTQEQISDVAGKSRVHVANTIRLLNLPPSIQSLLQNGSISAGHARSLLGAMDPLSVAKQIMSRHLSVRQTEDLVRRQRDDQSRAKLSQDDPHIAELGERLTFATGLKVSVNARGKSGRIVIRYRNLDQLDEVVARLENVAVRETKPSGRQKS